MSRSCHHLYQKESFLQLGNPISKACFHRLNQRAPFSISPPLFSSICSTGRRILPLFHYSHLHLHCVSRHPEVHSIPSHRIESFSSARLNRKKREVQQPGNNYSSKEPTIVPSCTYNWTRPLYLSCQIYTGRYLLVRNPPAGAAILRVRLPVSPVSRLILWSPVQAALVRFPLRPPLRCL